MSAKQIAKRLREIANQSRDATAAAIYEQGLALSAQIAPLIPVDYGRLRGSLFVSPPRVGDPNPEVQVGVATDYALVVHENLRAYHPTGQAKYIEKPFNAFRGGYLARVAKRAAYFLARGAGTSSVPATMPARPKVR
jgi:hypothetical protein